MALKGWLNRPRTETLLGQRGTQKTRCPSHCTAAYCGRGYCGVPSPPPPPPPPPPPARRSRPPRPPTASTRRARRGLAHCGRGLLWCPLPPPHPRCAAARTGNWPIVGHCVEISNQQARPIVAGSEINRLIVVRSEINMLIVVWSEINRFIVLGHAPIVRGSIVVLHWNYIY